MMEMGVKEKKIILKVVRKKNGEGKEVMKVRKDRGDLIIENIEKSVIEWKKKEYKYIKRK